MRYSVWYVILVAAALLNDFAQATNESREKDTDIVDITCELHLGDIPSCPASSCKEVAAVGDSERNPLAG